MNINEERIGIKEALPVELVFSPAWWFKNTGLTFDRDFFFHPLRRVEAERAMEKTLYEKWGGYGFGENRNEYRPEVGAVHLASGYLISEMLGCRVIYEEAKPPTVVPLNTDAPDGIDFENAFSGAVFGSFEKMCDKLKERHGYLTGDVNWSGILNIALDLRGEEIFMDMFDDPEDVSGFFSKIADVLRRFTAWIQSETKSSSVSVNRIVRHFNKPVFLHSECSNTMISVDLYEKFLFPYDVQWSLGNRPFGIHYCGADPHRFSDMFAKLPHLDFLDVGWGGDVNRLRKALPNTFLNIRLSPAELIDKGPAEIEGDIRRLVNESGNPWLTGVCCINMDAGVTDEKVEAILRTVSQLRKEFTLR